MVKPLNVWSEYYFAVTKDINYYMSLTESEADKCGGEEITFCKSTSSIHSVTHRPNCVLSFLTQDLVNVDKLCKKYSVNTSMPEIKHLFDGKWMIYRPTEEGVEITCLHSQPDSTTYLPKGISIFDQPGNCQAQSQSWILPVWLCNHSSAWVPFFVTYKLQTETI